MHSDKLYTPPFFRYGQLYVYKICLHAYDYQHRAQGRLRFYSHCTL